MRPDFIGVIASFFALISAVAIVTFTSYKRSLRVFLAVLIFVGIAALGWAEWMLSESKICEVMYMVTGFHVLCGVGISLLTSSQTVSEKIIDEPYRPGDDGGSIG